MSKDYQYLCLAYQSLLFLCSLCIDSHLVESKPGKKSSHKNSFSHLNLVDYKGCQQLS